MMAVMVCLDPSSQAYKKACRRHTTSRDPHTDPDWTAFRASEKKFKARYPPPDLADVLDLATLDESRVFEGGWRGRTVPFEFTEIGLKTRHKKAYTLRSHPGLVVLPAYIPPDGQRELIRWALQDHARSPNETNLDTHYLLPSCLWDSHIASLNSNQEVPDIQPRASVESPDLNDAASASGPRQLISNDAASPTNIYSLTLTASTQPRPAPSLTASPASPSNLIRKLRWANIGWYYHWGSKQYDFTRGKVRVAPQIKNVCESAVKAVNWDEVFVGDGEEGDWGDNGEDWRIWNETYEPDAGIVNYYQTKDTLMAHVDRSEVCATTPLVSVSLGCAAIFLIGGNSRDTVPTPILLRSGDVVIMSGPACRRAYHGVPRILENTLPAHLRTDPVVADDGWKPFEDYLRTTRINVNVRQVFPKGFDPIW